MSEHNRKQKESVQQFLRRMRRLASKDPHTVIEAMNNALERNTKQKEWAKKAVRNRDLKRFQKERQSIISVKSFVNRKYIERNFKNPDKAKTGTQKDDDTQVTYYGVATVDGEKVISPPKTSPGQARAFVRKQLKKQIREKQIKETDDEVAAMFYYLNNF